MLSSTLPLLLACATRGAPPPPGEGERVDVEEYHGMTSGNSWTWRDDGEDDIPEDYRLLRAQLLDGEVMDIRRGVRWADGDETAYLEWDLSDGLALSSWSIGDSAGEDSLPFVTDLGVWGGVADADSWSCEAVGPSTVETWYAIYQDVLQLVCKGDGPAGTWSFARERGLIHLMLDDGTTYDTVAGW